MNKKLFTSMREQMGPSEGARSALEEKLAAPRKKRVPVRRYAALAACAAVIAAAVPIYRAVQDHLKWQVLLDNFHPDAVVKVMEPHSYMLAEDAACWPEDAAATENSLTAGVSDEDQDMTPGELTDNLLEAGFSQEDVDAYLASGWQMTWAKWWKFYHLSEEGGERTLEALLEFSRSEGLAVSTGETPAEMPGGAYVSDMLVQENAVAAYQNLMARFETDYGPGKYPEWYGGAYIEDGADCLIVNVVEHEYYGAEIKALYAKIEDWAGSGRVAFRSSQNSLNYLRFLQTEVIAAIEELGLTAGCGISETQGQVVLTLPEATEEVLWRLAELDPTDTVIQVIVAQITLTDAPAEEPAPVAPSVSHTTGAGSVDEDGAIAWEPQG